MKTLSQRLTESMNINEGEDIVYNPAFDFAEIFKYKKVEDIENSPLEEINNGTVLSQIIDDMHAFVNKFIDATTPVDKIQNMPYDATIARFIKYIDQARDLIERAACLDSKVIYNKVFDPAVDYIECPCYLYFAPDNIEKTSDPAKKHLKELYMFRKQALDGFTGCLYNMRAAKEITNLMHTMLNDTITKLYNTNKEFKDALNTQTEE